MSALRRDWFPFRVVRYGDVDHPKGGDNFAVLSADDPDEKAAFYDCENEEKANAICATLNAQPLYDALVVSVRMALALVGGLDEEELSRAHDRRMESLALALATLDAQEEKQ